MVVYNWDLANSVDVDVSPLGISNESVTVRNVQDYYGTGQSINAVNGAVSIPMQGWTPVLPIGHTRSSVPATLPQFGVIVVEWDLTRSTPYRAPSSE